MKKRQNLTLGELFYNAALREVWPWHSRSKIRKITGKIGFKFFKLAFLGVKVTKLFVNLLKYKHNKFA